MIYTIGILENPVAQVLLNTQFNICSTLSNAVEQHVMMLLNGIVEHAITILRRLFYYIVEIVRAKCLIIIQHFREKKTDVAKPFQRFLSNSTFIQHVSTMLKSSWTNVETSVESICADLNITVVKHHIKWIKTRCSALDVVVFNLGKSFYQDISELQDALEENNFVQITEKSEGLSSKGQRFAQITKKALARTSDPFDREILIPLDELQSGMDTTI